MATPWYSSFTIPQLPPSPNLSLYLFQDKALEQQVYSSQMQWLSPEGGSGSANGGVNGNVNGNGTTGAARTQNDVLRWLGECVLRGLTGVLLTTLFPELDVEALEVRKIVSLFSSL